MAEQPGRSDRSLVAAMIGLAAAVPAFAATFNGPRTSFWSRMTFTGLGLGAIAIGGGREVRETRIRWRDIPLGLASAGVLYITFTIGDRFARKMVPSGDREIREIYALRTVRPRPEIALRLATIIGPAEELFWRGLVQGALQRRFGVWRAMVLTNSGYTGIHLAARNFTLLGAAGVAGLHWGVLRALRFPMGALIVSHIAWDIWIFLIQPTGETDLEPPEAEISPL
jgi:membrane protease YdiL (CAAX protease family)